MLLDPFATLPAKQKGFNFVRVEWLQKRRVFPRGDEAVVQEHQIAVPGVAARKLGPEDGIRKA